MNKNKAPMDEILAISFAKALLDKRMNGVLYNYDGQEVVKCKELGVSVTFAAASETSDSVQVILEFPGPINIVALNRISEAIKTVMKGHGARILDETGISMKKDLWED